MDTTLGIDLASQPTNTALCVIAWHDDGTAHVHALARGHWHDAPLDDRSLSGAIQGVGDGWGPRNYPVKAAIDAPFGWPAPFVDALTAHDRLDPWPSEINGERKRFERRATDFFVHEQGCKLPLSVSTDRIAYCAMRCAVILGDLSRVLDRAELARDGSGRVAEAYPDAALRRWLPDLWAGAPKDSYKGSAATAVARRELLLAGLLDRLGPAFTIAPHEQRACVDSDDVLDALVCALLARAVQQMGGTLWPAPGEQTELARTEGWIHLPADARLGRLLQG